MEAEEYHHPNHRYHYHYHHAADIACACFGFSIIKVPNEISAPYLPIFFIACFLVISEGLISSLLFNFFFHNKYYLIISFLVIKLLPDCSLITYTPVAILSVEMVCVLMLLLSSVDNISLPSKLYSLTLVIPD